ncbi:MAG: DNA repair protein RecO [Deltaproteobacteria bacterium]|nr:DNA repair protein RecO [Deltaproteobacteria bacterium]
MKRGAYSTHAVVLNSVDYAESDRILTFFTREHGKLSGIAKGARRSKKRFVGKLDPASALKLNFFHNGAQDLVRIDGADLINGFSDVKSDIHRYSAACYLLELTSEMTREGQDLPAVYGLLSGFLSLMNAGASSEALMRFFEIRLLDQVGLLPRFDSCASCGKGLLESGAEAAFRIRFDSTRGGAICHGCTRGLSTHVSICPGTARFMAAASRYDEDKLDRLKPGPLFLEESERALDDFITHQIGKQMKTKRFFIKLKGTLL